ncbi:MAG: arsenate reductase ArsC [Bacteroidaceae bacterium]|nr:arsenate reductase ArsC [Bacteroidaceae bacterium]
MKRILILCTGNSCRSQMAMGFQRAIDANLDVQSAGTNPTSAVNPYAIKTMAEVGIDLSEEQPKSVELYLGEEWNFVITVCGGANESCPTFTGKVGKRMHIGFDDPASATGTDEEIMEIFRRVRDEIKREMQKFYIVEVKGLRMPKCCCECS